MQAEAAFRAGERDAEDLRGMVRGELAKAGEIQYCEIVDPLTLETVSGSVDKPAAITVAVVVGKTRLIDNVLLSPSGDTSQFISHLE
jgi:pantoate--beta-alanine ligase